MVDTRLSRIVPALADAHAVVSPVQLASALDKALYGPTESVERHRYFELIHPRRKGRSKHQIGRKGLSNRRWIVGGKLCLLQNHLGLIIDWDCDTANVYDSSVFQEIVDRVAGQTVVFADTGFAKQDWQPDHLRVCQRGEWNDRMLIEPTLSMLTLVCHFKKVMHCGWAYFKSRLAYTMALFNILVQWHGLEPDVNGMVHLSITEFSL